MFGICFVCITFGPFGFRNHLDKEERTAGYFALIVFLMSCDS